ncbi:MAG: SGNH/GDSL hydrolase family protein [Planctomycetes bacterium]|nr:SGNH/GDSL hydrolase family protein [Planctomycetota bacterium]
MRILPRRPFARRALALVLGLAAALALAELLLRAANQPLSYKVHSHPPQFRYLATRALEGFGDVVLYVNAPSSSIRFVYDGDPRGTFGPACAVDHVTNDAGFRGPPFLLSKERRAFRLAFLGDSFTFGEGVPFADTFPERTVAALCAAHAGEDLRFEALNLGVGGHNTVQSLLVLREVALPLRPDLVVLGYALNDAEEPLFRPHASGMARWPREVEVPENLPPPAPRAGLLGRLRLVRLLDAALAARESTRRTIEHYLALYAEDARGFAQGRAALAEIAALCAEHDVPCWVLIFPVLHRLDGSYPFRSIHERVAAEARAAGLQCIDLLPLLEERDARALWVHPTDQHPNEVVHGIAAAALARALEADAGVTARLAALAGE